MAEAIKHSKLGSEPRSASDQTTELFPDRTIADEALSFGQIGIWSWDIASDAFRWSHNLATLHGVSAAAFDGRYGSFLKTIAVEDRSKVDAALKQAVRDRTELRSRYRVAHKLSEGRWLEISGTVVVTDRAVKSLFGLCCDVTERVNLEAQFPNPINQHEP